SRVRVEIGRRRPRRVAQLEPTQPVADVGGVADLAHLAVGDPIHPGIHLMLDPVAHGAADDAVELVGVHRLAPVLGEDEIDNLLGPRKAADVGGGDGAGLGAHAPTLLRANTPPGTTPPSVAIASSSPETCTRHAASSMRNGCMITVRSS